MGLDNGIQFKILDKQKFGKIPSWFRREAWADKYEYDYEILYWRKCWNVRSAILDYLCDFFDEEEVETNITPDQLEDIFAILKTLYTKENWNKGGSIWSWDEIGKNYPANLKYARKVLKWLKTKPEGSYQLYLYDSY